MIKYCVKKWDENKNRLENELREQTDHCHFEYIDLVKLVVKYILNDGEEPSYYSNWDTEKIVEMGGGGYSGTLIYIIPSYQDSPDEDDYLMTYIGYGSCSVCDVLYGIQARWGNGEKPTEIQLKDYMTLCKDIVCNIIKPYNHGWRYREEFDFAEEGEKMKFESSETSVNAGERIPMNVINQCDHPIEVGLGIVFGEDGTYVVKVSKNTIRVSKGDPADVEEVRYGKWVADAEDVYWGNYIVKKHCSRCGFTPRFNRETELFDLSKYCPDCGAKMDGEMK